MAVNQDRKKRVLVALLICSTAMLFKACNGTLVKEEKKGVIIEPPTFEEIKFEDIYEPPTETSNFNETELNYDDGYSVTDQTENVRGTK